MRSPWAALTGRRRGRRAGSRGAARWAVARRLERLQRYHQPAATRQRAGGSAVGAIVGGAGHNAGRGNRNASRSRSGHPGHGLASRTGVLCIDRGGTQVNMGPRPRKLQLLRWLPGAIVKSRAPARGNAIYLTFDDGPHPEYTPRVLDVLARHGARGSFFLIGDKVRAHPDLARRIAAEGHAIGNHSNSHPEFRALSLPQQVRELALADIELERIDGQRDHLVRTPRGALPPRLVLDLARRGRPIVFWSYDTLDYRRGPAAEVIEMIRREPPQPGDILLLHDDGPAVIEVLEAMLPEWAARGLAPRALPAYRDAA